MPESQSLTRRQLYDLVWSKPMSKLAEDLGISDVAIRKLCVKKAIVRPPQGYWNRVLAGRPVKQTPFKEHFRRLVEKKLLLHHGAGRSTWYGLP